MKSIYCLLTALLIFSSGLFAEPQRVLFDVYVRGPGYFAVQLADGTLAYTRTMSILQNESGTLTNEDSYLISPSITVNPLSHYRLIYLDGSVVAMAPGEHDYSLEGKISLYRFANSSALKPIGGGLFLETKASGSPEQTDNGKVVILN